MEEAMERAGAKIIDLLADELLIDDNEMGAGLTVLASVIGSLASCVQRPEVLIDQLGMLAKEVASGQLNKDLN